MRSVACAPDNIRGGLGAGAAQPRRPKIVGPCDAHRVASHALKHAATLICIARLKIIPRQYHKLYQEGIRSSNSLKIHIQKSLDFKNYFQNLLQN